MEVAFVLSYSYGSGEFAPREAIHGRAWRIYSICYFYPPLAIYDYFAGKYRLVACTANQNGMELAL